MKKNNITDLNKLDNLIETYMDMNEMTEVAPDYFEDAGGGIWHVTNLRPIIEDAIQTMPFAELQELEDMALLNELGL